MFDLTRPTWSGCMLRTAVRHVVKEAPFRAMEFITHVTSFDRLGLPGSARPSCLSAVMYAIGSVGSPSHRLCRQTVLNQAKDARHTYRCHYNRASTFRHARGAMINLAPA